MDFTPIIKFFLSSSLIIAGVVYFAKFVLNKFVELRMEKYKNSLLKDTESFRFNLNSEAEKFRHTLNTASIEHQIRYSKLYEERGQIIKEIYNLLLNLENALADLTTIYQGPEWITDTLRDEKAKESIHNLRNHLERNRIFFSVDLCGKIESIIKSSQKITIEMIMAKKTEQRNENYNRRGIPTSQEDLLKPTNTWNELDEQVQNEIKSARLNLAHEFRGLIGVT